MKKQQLFQSYLLLLLLLLTSIGLMACGSDTERSSLNQQRDRERVAATSQVTEYASVSGEYQTAATLDHSKYLLLVIDFHN